MNNKANNGQWGLITGCARQYGLGEAFAKNLARKNVNLVLVDILEGELQIRAQELIAQYGIEVRTVVLDMGRDDIIAELTSATQDLEITMLVCNHYYLSAGEFHTISVDEHIKMMNVNVRSYMLMAHYFGKKMIKKGQGDIVMVSSLSAIMPLPFNVHYSSFKAYISNMAEALHGEMKPHGVNSISVIAPFMNSADAREADIPQWILADTNKVVKAVISKLGKRSRIIPGFSSALLYFIFVRLMGRTKGLSRFGKLIWESVKNVALEKKG